MTINILTKCLIRDLGTIDYQEAYQIQKQCVEQALKDGLQTVLLCEHPPVLTLGRLAKEEFILLDRKELEEKGISVQPVDRGGEVTLHAPGQLVIYPILNLQFTKKDLHLYIERLEKVAIDLLNDFGIMATRNLRNTGVWIGQKKIVSIGVGVKRWITYHGLAINVNTDLKLFSLIKPCGLDVAMTSMKEIKGQAENMSKVKQKAIEHLEEIFNLKCAAI
jgi:lipoate-protein ligase B